MPAAILEADLVAPEVLVQEKSAELVLEYRVADRTRLYVTPPVGEPYFLVPGPAFLERLEGAGPLLAPPLWVLGSLP